MRLQNVRINVVEKSQQKKDVKPFVLIYLFLGVTFVESQKMTQNKIEFDINRHKLLKIEGLIRQVSDELVRDLKLMEVNSLDRLQMQTYILGFHECFRIVKGVIDD